MVSDETMAEDAARCGAVRDGMVCVLAAGHDGPHRGYLGGESPRTPVQWGWPDRSDVEAADWPDADTFVRAGETLRAMAVWTRAAMDATQAAMDRLAETMDQLARATADAAKSVQDDYALAPPPTDETRPVAAVVVDDGGTWRCGAQSWQGEGLTAQCVRHAGHPGRHELEDGTTW